MKGHWFVLVPPGQRQGDDPDLPPLGMHPCDAYAWMAERWECDSGHTDDGPWLHHVADLGAVRWIGRHRRERVLVWHDGALVSLEKLETEDWMDLFNLVDLYLFGNVGAGA